MKFTPGPWYYGSDWAEHGAVANVGPDVEYVYASKDDTWFDKRSLREQLANAFLVAAAPSLYWACRHALKYLRQTGCKDETLMKELRRAIQLAGTNNPRLPGDPPTRATFIDVGEMLAKAEQEETK